MEIKNLRALRTVTQWLFILGLPWLLLSASIAGAVNSHWLYHYGFNKYNISQTTGLTDAELDNIAQGLINYFNSDEDYIRLTVEREGKPFPLFNQREIIHLRDVKGLFHRDYWVLLGTLAYALSYIILSLLWRQDRRQLGWGLVGGGGLTLGVMLALGVGILLNFDQLFWQFHLISFANELWQLDPTQDSLIQLFPGGFWYDAALFCVLFTTVGAVVVGGVGGYLLYRGARPVDKGHYQ